MRGWYLVTFNLPVLPGEQEGRLYATASRWKEGSDLELEKSPLILGMQLETRVANGNLPRDHV